MGSGRKLKINAGKLAIMPFIFDELRSISLKRRARKSSINLRLEPLTELDIPPVFINTPISSKHPTILIGPKLE
jgi:hypothetical protein